MDIVVIVGTIIMAVIGLFIFIAMFTYLIYGIYGASLEIKENKIRIDMLKKSVYTLEGSKKSK